MIAMQKQTLVCNGNLRIEGASELAQEPFEAFKQEYGDFHVLEMIQYTYMVRLAYARERSLCVHEGKVAVSYPASRLKEHCLRALMEIRAFPSLSQ